MGLRRWTKYGIGARRHMKAVAPLGRSAALCLAAIAVLVMARTATASADVLYDQTGGTPTGLVASEENVQDGQNDCGGGASFKQNCIAADDFTVPPGPGWTIDDVYVLGSGGNTGSACFAVEINPDAGGIPPGGVANPAGGGGAGGGVFGLTGADNFDFHNPLGSVVPDVYIPPTLAPGTYWLEVFFDPNCGTGSLSQSPIGWSWRTVSPQAGLPAVWDGTSLSCPAGVGVIWRPLADCGKPGPDLAFRLSGQLGGAFSVSPTLLGKMLRVLIGTSGTIAVNDASSPSVLSAQSAKKRPLVKPTTVNASRAGYVTVKLKLTAPAKTKLRQKGKLRLRLRVSFKPTGGSTSSKVVTVLVKGKAK